MINIPVDNQTRLYELTYLLPHNLTDAELTAAKEEVAALIAKYEGEVISQEDWGKRQLAYGIRYNGKRHDEAIYTFLVIRFSPDRVQKFENELKLSELVMRQLFVVSDEQDLDQVEATANQGDEKLEE